MLPAVTISSFRRPVTRRKPWSSGRRCALTPGSGGPTVPILFRPGRFSVTPSVA